jgi:DNA-binding NarL/FixJ family response regulator
MAVINQHIKGVCVINIVIVSHNAEAEMLLLADQTEMQVSHIVPSTIEQVMQQVADVDPDVIVIDHGLDNVSADILCHFLNKKCPEARSIMLIETQPNFEMLENSGFKVRGFLTVEQRPMLAKAIRVVHDGEAWLPRKLVADMLNRFAASFINTEAPQLPVN